jgi:hypothetical protein
VTCYLVTRQIISGLRICWLDLFGMLPCGITTNHNTLNLTISTLRSFFTGWFRVLFCTPSPDSLSFLRAPASYCSPITDLKWSLNSLLPWNWLHLELTENWPPNISKVALYSLRATRTENSASIVETCLPNHCIATVAALTAANSLLRCLLPSNEQ